MFNRHPSGIPKPRQAFNQRPWPAGRPTLRSPGMGGILGRDGTGSAQGEEDPFGFRAQRFAVV